MDIDYYVDLPGGDNFEDVTELFVEGASQMMPGSVIMSEGFTLMDAMSAFEIGEPRMDSGMILEQADRPTFEPLTPLLPQEICWILDTSLSCEMEWHNGNTLSQTVFTLLYTHHLGDIDPDLVMQDKVFEDPQRPIGLVTIVLRAAVLGLLKCCDFAWRELSQGKVHDTEDWQSEKCDISLMEGVPAEHAIWKLDEACTYLRHAPISIQDRDALCDRILLRKALLEVYRLNLSEHKDMLRPLLVIARNALHRVRSLPPTPNPAPGSHALLAFDPYITRRLHNFIPMRIIDLGSTETTWIQLGELLQSWEDLDRLLNSHSLSAWEIGGSVRAWSTKYKLPVPFIRSLFQTSFFERNHVLSQHPALWLVDRFFLETLGMSHHLVQYTLQRAWASPGPMNLKEIERNLIKILVQHVRSFWFNPPRRRRCLMKLVLEWQTLHDALQSLTFNLLGGEPHVAELALMLPKTATLWQLSAAREIILSGFQQDLYAPHERPISYWYTAQVIELQLTLLDEFKSRVRKDSITFAELRFQSEFLIALQMLSVALCAITSKSLTLSSERMALNFRRRYKWLFVQSFPDNIEEMLIPLPPFENFERHISELKSGIHFSPRDVVQHAKQLLNGLCHINPEESWAPKEARERLEVLVCPL
ncbi:hypothetical protein NLI96_g2764 [Meripilus lineatus]|uniref:Uncharacterized protein n=1 Tax=Meripilus lineatus TaxID=2056292 RepID=A0AAD5VCQ5_9APHY|nr:hypothetical protein NLI96_g2764 [Physisporinus lineatus]